MITKQIILNFDEEFQNWFVNEGKFPSQNPFSPSEIAQAIESLQMYVKYKHQNYLINQFMLKQSNDSLESNSEQTSENSEGVLHEDVDVQEIDDKEINLEEIENV